MMEKIWKYILENEDRIIYNSDRKHYKHFYSIETTFENSMYQKNAAIYEYNDPFYQVDFPFLETIENEQLLHALGTLTQKQKQVIDLYFYKGMSNGEIAQFLHCKPQTITQLLGRALVKLKEKLL